MERSELPKDRRAGRPHIVACSVQHEIFLKKKSQEYAHFCSLRSLQCHFLWYKEICAIAMPFQKVYFKVVSLLLLSVAHASRTIKITLNDVHKAAASSLSSALCLSYTWRILTFNYGLSFFVMSSARPSSVYAARRRKGLLLSSYVRHIVFFTGQGFPEGR